MYDYLRYNAPDNCYLITKQNDGKYTITTLVDDQKIKSLSHFYSNELYAFLDTIPTGKEQIIFKTNYITSPFWRRFLDYFYPGTVSPCPKKSIFLVPA